MVAEAVVIKQVHGCSVNDVNDVNEWQTWWDSFEREATKGQQ